MHRAACGGGHPEMFQSASLDSRFLPGRDELPERCNDASEHGSQLSGRDRVSSDVRAMLALLCYRADISLAGESIRIELTEGGMVHFLAAESGSTLYALSSERKPESPVATSPTSGSKPITLSTQQLSTTRR